jgi:hypothetical protein
MNQNGESDYGIAENGKSKRWKIPEKL